MIDREMSFPTYLAAPAYGSHSLKAFRAGPPAMVPWLRENPSETDATRFGTACHSRILTPDLFARTYAILPADAPDRPTEAMLAAAKPSPSSVARQAWWKDWNEATQGKIILSAKVAREVEAVAAAFYGKALAAESLEAAAGIEASCFWTCPESGLPSKCRPDWWTEDAVYDLKVSVHAARGNSLGFRAYVEGHMHQLAHHRTGLNENGVPVKYGRLVMIPPKPPYFVRCIEVKEAALDVLALDNEQTRKAMMECEKSGVWPSTPDDWQKVEPPPSALAEIASDFDTSGAEEV